MNAVCASVPASESRKIQKELHKLNPYLHLSDNGSDGTEIIVQSLADFDLKNTKASIATNTSAKWIGVGNFIGDTDQNGTMRAEVSFDITNLSDSSNLEASISITSETHTIKIHNIPSLQVLGFQND